MPTLHLSNAQGRNARTLVVSIKPPAQASVGLLGEDVVFRRYLSASSVCGNDLLMAKYGEDWSQALLDGDPEIDMEAVGQLINETSTVYLDSSGELMFVEPRFIESIINPDGSEKERREPQELAANINDDAPLRWSGRKVPIKDAIRKFCFRRTMQLKHIDGLTYDFLFNMAKELESEQNLVLLGSGEKGIGPLIFQANGRGYRGFLEGRTDGNRYQLLLHLSDMELKFPVLQKKESSNA